MAFVHKIVNKDKNGKKNSFFRGNHLLATYM